MGRALIRVLASNDSPKIFANAKALVYQLGPQEGRVVACETIIEFIEAHKKGEEKKDQNQKNQAEEVTVQQVPGGNEERTPEVVTSQEIALGTLNAMY